MNKINKEKEFTPLEVCPYDIHSFETKKDIIAPLFYLRSREKIFKNEKFFHQRLLTGFTLTEILVALTIFVIISVTLGGIVIQMAELQAAITGRNQQISELRLALDYISNSVANAQNPPGNTGLCIPINTNFEFDTITRRIRFVNVNNRCQEIFLSPLVAGLGRIQTRISTNATTGGFTGQPIIDLTSNIITRFDIRLRGYHMVSATPPDHLQPRITISIASNIPGLDLPIIVQRSVSRIKLDN